MVAWLRCLQYSLFASQLLTTRHCAFAFSPLSLNRIVSQTAVSLKMSSSAEETNNLIMVVGSANQDLTSNTDVLPTMGETVMGKDFGTACGGKGANQAVAAASLQLAPVATAPALT